MIKKSPIKAKHLDLISSTQPNRKIANLVRSRHASPHKQAKSENYLKIPKLSLDICGPRKAAYPANRPASSESNKYIPTITVKGIIKVSHSPATTRIRKPEKRKTFKDFSEIVVSPINKIPCSFFNRADKSLIKVLENLR